MDGRALADLMLSLRCGAERRAIPSCPEPTEVRYGSLADTGVEISDVRFTPESGHVQRRHRCLL